jgi:hypothetical protein
VKGVILMEERPKSTKDNRSGKNEVIDLTQDGSPLLEGLKKPVRKVAYTHGSTEFVFPRGADDPTPDEVIEVGGVFHNARTGAVGNTLEDVM